MQAVSALVQSIRGLNRTHAHQPVSVGGNAKRALNENSRSSLRRVGRLEALHSLPIRKMSTQEQQEPQQLSEEAIEYARQVRRSLFRSLSPRCLSDDIRVCLQFFDAARRGDVAFMEEPLKAGLPANLTNSVSTCERDFSRRLNLRTPLMNNLSCIAPFGGTTLQSGDTLIMLAAYHGHPEAVSLLLKHGADPKYVPSVSPQR